MTVEIFDVHYHFGRHYSEWLDGEPAPDAEWAEATYQERVEEMGRVGCDRSVVLPGDFYPRVDGLAATRRANDLVHGLVQRDPDRFPFGLGTVDPQYGPAGLAEIDRIHDIGLIGVTYHPRWQGLWADDPWIVRQVDRLAELAMLPMIHCVAESTLESPMLIELVASRHPEHPLVVLDAMSGPTSAKECRAIAHRNPNLWFDISIAWHPLEVLQFVREVGHERLVFGRPGWTVSSPETLLAFGGGLPQQVVDDIVRHNLDRLLAGFAKS
ncbi:MAG: amidohydrolase family protein [Acidimicrobiales bacterium]|nr:amidohydrolase family protein [Acidimicrobiales bacterium]